MHPLRFPNNGIRAKAVRRRGGQPRLAPMQDRPPTARPQPRPPTRGQPAAARASPQGRPTLLVGAAARMGNSYGHSQLRPARRGGSRPRAHPLAARRPQKGSVVGRLQGAAARGQSCR
ncbi:hypothetical protein BHM03_00046158 [Ensete ventricosum]|nr:hypothetical protein BHM03_00046158 [Ensete ventricosum]